MATAETHIRTPRGTIRYAFDTYAEARDEGWHLWFAHDHNDGSDKPYTAIVTKDNMAVAVRERLHPYSL